MPARFRIATASLIVAACATIVGCATATPAGTRFNPQAAPIANAGFRLQGVRITWQDNPAFNYRFSYLASRSNPNAGPSEAQRTQVTAQMSEILQIFRNNAVPGLTQALVSEGVGPGAEHRIVLTPMSAFQAVNGEGTSITVRATVLGSAGHPLWNIDIESHSGLQWFGPRFSKPDDSYVRHFVSSLVDSMREAGLVGNT